MAFPVRANVGWQYTVDSVNGAGLALTALDLPDLLHGTQVFVRSVKDVFTLDITSSATADNITVAAAVAVPGGRWIRQCIPHKTWSNQLVWYYNATSGSDENSGATGFPIKSLAELIRRLQGADLVTSNLVVNVTGNIPSGELTDFAFLENAASIQIKAAPSIFFTGTITATIPLNKTTGQAWEITDTAIPTSWTASNLIGKILVADDGDAVTGTAYVLKDAGSKRARVSVPTTNDTLFTTAVTAGTVGTFNVADNYTVYSFQTWNATSNIKLNHVPVYVYGFNFTVAVNPVGPKLNFHPIFCIFSAGYSYGQSAGRQCLFQTTFSTDSGLSANGGPADSAFLNCTLQISKKQWSPPGEQFLQASTISFTGSASGHITASLAIFDTTTTMMNIDSWATVYVNQLWGAGNTGTIVSIVDGCQLFYTILPTIITTSLVPVSISGTTYQLSDLPIINLARQVLVRAL